MRILAGLVDVQSNTLRIGNGSGVDNISISGTLKVNTTATLDMDNGSSLNVNNGGSIELLGTDKDNRALLTSSASGRYSFDVNSGGSIKASFYTVEYTDADGLYMHPGANIDATYNLSDGTFSNGFPASGSYMTLLHEMGAEETLSNLVFNAGPAYNVTRTSGTTIFHFEDASGVLGNYEYEKDDEVTPSPSSGLLRWPFVNLYTWEGDVNNSWFTAGNWYDDQLPVPTADVTIPATVTDPVIDNSTLAEMNALTIEAGATVTVEPGAQVTISGDVTTNNGLIIQNTDASPALLINEGVQTGDAIIIWSYPENRYWYIGHAISNPMIASYDAITPGNAYVLYEFENSAWNNLTGVGDGFAERLEGYGLKIRDAGAIISHTGVLNRGDFDKDLAVGWQLIANPYASYYQLPKEDTPGADFENTTGSVYIRTGSDPVSRVVVTYNTLNGIFTPETFNGVVAPMQSFWVKRASVGKVFMKQSNRIHDPAKSALKTSSLRQQPDLLRMKLSNSSLIGEAVLALRNNGQFDYSRNDSEQRFENNIQVPYIYSIKQDQKVVIPGSLRPLRTVRASFPAYGSGTSKVLPAKGNPAVNTGFISNKSSYLFTFFC